LPFFEAGGKSRQELARERRRKTMNITIIGTANMARGIGTRLVAGGNSVTRLGRVFDL